ncbi:hypothetical protein Q8A67_007987 [Cirrhinus molitorella]|uniref:Uncharacterized protein n=1 Tax=Cirrhinus molitorella TaxID=172907 RepID=A0AA88Q372_9TELE|nr:hypothetical protein Q8A67_007987 [Cirrhinus molitorella]
MNSAISKSTQCLTTAEDMRNQTKLMMQPYANWEEYLTPAPLSIAILGELVFISSTTDFSINKNSPKHGYKFIKYPDSFRACLMQVCNTGWWAFNEAHTSMDQIRLHTAQVPDYMKTAVKILFQGNDEVVKAHLPDQLDNIRVIADECLKLSDATEKRFTEVINIIQELLEACVNAEHFYGEEMEAIKKKLEESKLREQSAQETKKRTEKVMGAMEKELEQAQESYKKALDSLPNGWEMIGMDLVAPPMMLREEKKLENTTPSQRATENARFTIEQSRAQMNKTKETYDKCFEKLEKNQKELTEILVTMRNCELKEIDFRTTTEMLVKGMDAMGRVKEQWEKMVHFFQMVSNIVKTSLNKTLTNFVSTSEKTQALSYNGKLFSKDLLYTQAFQASNIASLVHMISATYTDVSSKYLMDRVSSLGKLMAMDKSKPEFEQERQQLQNGCDEAQKGILRLVLKNKDEYDRKSTARLEKIDRELLAILPAAPPEEIKSIQEAVQAGFNEEEEAAAAYY